MKRYILGDVHGSGNELLGLLDKMSPVSGDEILLVGDVFDRGLHAHLVWDALRDVKAVYRGNHEDKMLSWLLGKREGLPVHYYVAMNLLMEHGVAPSELLAFLESLSVLGDFGEYMVVHGGVVIDSPATLDVSMNVYYRQGRNRYASDVLMSQDASVIGGVPILAPNDGRYWWDLYDGDKLVIYGHVVCEDNLPRIRRNRSGVNSIGLDTAVVHGGSLSAYCPEEDKFYSYSSGVDWSKKCKSRSKEKPPIVNSVLLKFVKEMKEANRVL